MNLQNRLRVRYIKTKCKGVNRMKSVKQLLIELETELQEIADDSADVETQSQLNELIDRIWTSVE